MAFGALSALAVGAAGSPAVAQEDPTAVGRCFVRDLSKRLTVTFSGFQPFAYYDVFAVVKEGDGSTRVFQGLSLGTDDSGSGSPGETYVNRLPVTVATAVNDDTNDNGRWDPDIDGTVYRGSGTLTTCPEDVIFSPK